MAPDDTLQVKVAGLWVSVTELRDRTARGVGSGRQGCGSGRRVQMLIVYDVDGADARRLDICQIRDSDAAGWLS